MFLSKRLGQHVIDTPPQPPVRCAHGVVAERIDEAADPRVGDYVHAGDPGWLREHGLFLAEGRLVVERLILGRRFVIRSILLTPPALSALGAALATVRCPV